VLRTAAAKPATSPWRTRWDFGSAGALMVAGRAVRTVAFMVSSLWSKGGLSPLIRTDRSDSTMVGSLLGCRQRSGARYVLFVPPDRSSDAEPEPQTGVDDPLAPLRKLAA